MRMQRNAADWWTLTGVVDLHVSEGLQRVLEGDAVQLQRSDAVVHYLSVGDELVGELLDQLGGQVPTQPVLRADRRRAAKHHLTWEDGTQRDITGQEMTREDGDEEAGQEAKQYSYLLIK